MTWDIFKEVGEILIEMGGAGSGHRGHKGVKGQRGGSAPSRGRGLTSSAELSSVFGDLREENRAKETVTSWKSELSRAYGQKRKMAGARLAMAEKDLAKASQNVDKWGSWKAPGYGEWIMSEKSKGSPTLGQSRSYSHSDFGEIILDMAGGIGGSERLAKRGAKESAMVTYKTTSVDWEGRGSIKKAEVFLNEHFGIET